MEEEMRQLQEMVAQLRADNERLRQEQANPQVQPNTAALPAAVAGSSATGNEPSARERLVVVPRERKCPMFSGRAGLEIREWKEEVKACMRARRLSTADQAFFIYDHLEGKAKEEIKYRPSAERGDAEAIFKILDEIYGPTQSYVTLQQQFFSRQQQEGETLHEYSLALLALMEEVKQSAPGEGLLNSEVLLRDQFVEHVSDGALRRELKQFVRQQPTATLLRVREEALRWEREGLPGGARARSFSLPSAYGLQYAVRGSPQPPSPVAAQSTELAELKTMMKRQQEQLNQLTQTVAALQPSRGPRRTPLSGPIVCRRCQRTGHFAQDCDNERVPARSRPHSSSGPTASGSGSSHRAAPGNGSPLGC